MILIQAAVLILAYVLMGALTAFVMMIDLRRRRVCSTDQEMYPVMAWLFWPIVVVGYFPMLFILIFHAFLRRKADAIADRISN